jgi:hypothetical protein
MVVVGPTTTLYGQQVPDHDLRGTGALAEPGSLGGWVSDCGLSTVDQVGGCREPGFSQERRLDPQITIGLLTGQDGFPLLVSAFEGNKAETKTMLPVIELCGVGARLLTSLPGCCGRLGVRRDGWYW